MRKKVIPIYFASDKNYVPYLTVAVKSLVKFASDKNIYKIFILTNNLQESDITEIRSMERNNVMIQLVDVNFKINSIKDKVQLRDYYSVSIYFRLFIPTMFPEFNKAIYLDADIVLNRDIADMFNENIGDNYLGAILDEVVYSNEKFIYYIKGLYDLTEKQYFNSGALVMNLKKFRDNDIENDFYRWLNSNSSPVAPDQDYLNTTCRNKVKYLDAGWNKMPLGQKLEDSKLYLIHYNMFMKPWKYANGMFDSYFWEVAKTTTFYDKLLTQRNSYTEQQRANDALAAENLLKLAVNIGKQAFMSKQAKSAETAPAEVFVPAGAELAMQKAKPKPKK